MVNKILELFWAFIKIYCVVFVIGDGVTHVTYTLFLNKKKNGCTEINLCD